MSNSLPPFLATDPDVYEHFMGRWSTRLAKPFLEFASVRPGDRVLDVGCGTGTLSLALAEQGARVVGMDASESYLEGARRRRSHANVTYEHGDACHLQYVTGSFDACVSTLAIDVIPEVDLVAAEMRRVTRPGGIVSCGTLDFWGGNSVMDLVLDTGAVLHESISTLRDQIKTRPIVWANGQANLWRKAGLIDVIEVPIVLSFDYTDFQDYWSSFSTGPSRIAQGLMALPQELRSEIERHVRAGYLAGLPDGGSIACGHRQSGARDSSATMTVTTKRDIALCFALYGLSATAIAQTVAPENWTPIGRMAQTITGRVMFTPSEITFQNGRSLPLAGGGQMLFRPEPKQKKVLTDLYRVTSPDDPILENGNKLCKGKPIAYLIVWKSEKIGNETDPRTLAPFSGPKLNAGSPDDCGRYTYDASQR